MWKRKRRMWGQQESFQRRDFFRAFFVELERW